MNPRDFPDDILIRDYQITLMDVAYKRNTIVYLPTGTGKTLIAVMLLKKLSTPLQKPISCGGQISIMVANTTALVDQHSEYLKRLVPFEVGTYSGSACSKPWSKNVWKEKLDKFQVFVTTPRVLCNILKDSTISFTNINLLILDECHRAVNNHPMSEIMENYANVQDFPRVLGLTATLLNKNCSSVNVINEIKQLEKTLHSEIITVDTHRTKRFSTNPNEIIKTFTETELTGAALTCISELNNLLCIIENFKLNSLNTSSERILKELKSIVQDTIVQIQIFGTYGGKIAVKLHINQLIEYQKAPNLDGKILIMSDSILTVFKWIKTFFKLEMAGSSLFSLFSNRLLLLLDILKQHKQAEKSQFCAIIFIKRRLTVKILCHILRKITTGTDREYENLNLDYVLGSNNASNAKSALLGLYKAKVYKRVIEQFCKRHINLLVASNVLEEGIDIPTCSLIINFDEPKDYRGYVQSKGRARSKNSNYYVLISKSNYGSFMRSYESYKKTQEILQEYFNKERLSCESSDIEIEDAYKSKPLNINISQITPTLDTAVELINLYCSSLPHDKYTTYTPKWTLKENKTPASFKASVRLPIICQNVGIIEGPHMQSETLAVNAAAVKACKLLKEKGELDDDWLPKSHTEIEDENEHFFQHSQKYMELDETLKSHVYAKMAPNILRHQIVPNKASYVHVIQLEPQFHQTTSVSTSQFHILQHLSSSTSFGFVTAQLLPQLCDFHVYVPEGPILIKVQVNRLAVSLATNQIQDLRIFHYYVFKDVAGVLEDFLVFNNEKDAEMLLMIPVCTHGNSCGTNWEILQAAKLLLFKKIDSNEDRIPIKESEKKLVIGKVVTATTNNQNYLIYCSYPNAELQGRLLVQTIDYLKPNNQKVVLKCLKASQCYVQEFPADLWTQASLLPSILHRIMTILQADELKDLIVRGTRLGAAESSSCKNICLPLACNKSEINGDNLSVMDNSIISMNFNMEYVYKTSNYKGQMDTNFVYVCYKMILSQLLLSESVPSQEKSRPLAIEPADNHQITEIHLLKHKRKLGGPEIIDVMKALTGIKCNDVINYERAETLGDSFLKFTISLFIILKYPDYNEGKATVLKSSIISNKNLFYIGLENKLFKYVHNTSFTAWKPPGFSVPKELKTLINRQELSVDDLDQYKFEAEEVIAGVLLKEGWCLDCKKGKKDGANYCFVDQEMLTNKTIADCVEALIGIYFESCGLLEALKILTWLKIMPPSENIENLFTMNIHNPLLKRDATNEDLIHHIPAFYKIETALNYEFKNLAYLLQAVTHSSYNCNYLTDCYQRLEFLGDAVLDFLITCYIYEMYEHLNPGELTDLRSALVNNVTFAGFTVRCGFYKFLLLSNANLLHSIDNYVQFQESQGFAISDNVLILSEENNLFIAEHVEVPKVLGDLFESLAAAVFLDSGMDLQVVWNVFYRIVAGEIENFAKNVPKNAVRLLYEATEAKPYFHPPKVMDTGSTMVAVDITLLAGDRQTIYGFGENKRSAKKAAAKLAFRLLCKQNSHKTD